MLMMTMVVMMVIVSSFLLQTNAGVVANEKVWNATAHADQGLKVVIDRNFDRQDNWSFFLSKRKTHEIVFNKVSRVSLSGA